MQKKVRQSQSERTASTRKRLLDAAVECLFQHGYAAATTAMIADVAGVSRGGMLYQFPSKAEMMAALIEADHEEEVRLYAELLADIDNPQDRLTAYPKAVWHIMRRPAAVAVLEIYQASRSDADLRAKIAQAQSRSDKLTRETLDREFPGENWGPLLQMIVGLARGLAIANVLTPNDGDLDRAITLFQRLLRSGIKTGELFNDGRSKRVKAEACLDENK